MTVQSAQDEQFTFVAGLPLREKVLYAAGLFDGEGCLHLKKASGKKHKSDKWRLTLASTDFDIVNNFYAAMLDKGTVVGPYCVSNRKPYWVWSTIVQSDIYALVVMMYPFLSARRKQKIETFIEWYKGYTKGARK